MQVKNEAIFTAGLLIVTVAMVGIAFTFGETARLVPLVIGIPTIILLLLQLLIDINPSVAKAFASIQSTDMFGMSKGKAIGKKAKKKHEKGMSFLTAVFWAVLFYLGYRYVGYVWAVPIILLLYLKLQVKENWRVTIGLTVSVGIFVYVLFYWFMGLRM